MKKIKKKNKLRAAIGADLTQYAGTANFTADIANAFIPSGDLGQRSDVASAGMGALKGAATGAAAGPLGAAVGAVVGGGLALAQNEKLKKQSAALANQRNMNVNKMLMNNTTLQPTKLAKGGKVNKIAAYVKGGQLKKISPDAVEVQANDPSETDGVDIGKAYVDNGEVIDNKQRVFSDDRGYAKIAKKLEKQKAKSGSARFAAADARIESKLDDLFAHQEATNPENNTAGGLADGGSWLDTTVGPYTSLRQLGPSIMTSLGNYASSGLKSLSGLLNKAPVVSNGSLNPNVIRASKTTFKKGGKLGMATGGWEPNYKLDPNYTPGGIGVNSINYKGKLGSLKMNNIAQTENGPADPGKNKWDTVNSTLGTFGPNLVNGLLTNALPSPPTPNLENSVNLQRFSANGQLAETSRQANLTNRNIKQNTAQAGNYASNIGAVMAKRLSANNQINQNVNNQNAQVQGQEAMINSGIQARNVERINQNKMYGVERKNTQLSSYSQNTANVGEKLLAQGREKNQKLSDLDQLDLLKQMYKDSGVYDRSIEDIMTRIKKRNGMGKSKGGMLGRKLTGLPVSIDEKRLPKALWSL